MFLRAISVISVFLLAVMIGGCSSTPRVQEVKVEKPAYKVLDATPGGREGWLDNPQSWAEDMKDEKRYDVANHYFYSGEGNSASKDLACEKAMSTMKDGISKQIATFVDTAISRAASESSHSSNSQVTANSEASEEVERISTQLSKSMVSGVVQKKKYWEQRDYSEVGGAASIYYCWILGQASKTDVKAMINKANNLRVSSNPELKEKVQEKIANVEADYDKFMKSH